MKMPPLNPWLRRLPALGRWRSIRGFMTVAIALLLALLAITDGALAYHQAVRQLGDGRDRALGRIAAGYLRSLRAFDADPSKIPLSVFREEVGDGGAAELPKLRYRVSDERGHTLGGDATLPLAPASVGSHGPAMPDVYDLQHGPERLRVAAVRDDLLVRAEARSVIVQVAEPIAVREAAERELLLQTVMRQAVRLAIMLALVWLVIRLGLRPLDQLAHELRQRRTQDLSLVTRHRPEELMPMVSALNELLQAQQDSIDQQRKFLTDASHQLRTPIAVLRTQVQGLMQGQTEAADTLPLMLGTIERATGLTNQLLSMAKTEQLVRRGNWHDVPLEQVARDVAVEFAPLIARKRLDFSLQALPITLRTDAWLLGELVKNLLSNAIHHSRKGGALGIVVRQLKHEVEMVVWDHGGGVDEDVLGRLFVPFNVARGGTGIGLGLSICRQIAESMNASVDLFNRIEAGLVIGVDAVVRWPRPLGDGAVLPSQVQAHEPAQELRHG
jgi:two-component system sensor histidine kinase TctE